MARKTAVEGVAKIRMADHEDEAERRARQEAVIRAAIAYRGSYRGIGRTASGQAMLQRRLFAAVDDLEGVVRSDAG